MCAERTPREDEVRDQDDKSTNQGTPKSASRPPDAGREAWNRFSLTASDGPTPADISIADFCLPELYDNQLLWYFYTAVLTNSPKENIHASALIYPCPAISKTWGKVTFYQTDMATIISPLDSSKWHQHVFQYSVIKQPVTSET